ncbi:MAG: MarR family transcriptional regulator [Terriglobales bacterium]
MDAPTLPDYRTLAELRYQIRRFLRFSEDAARKAGIEPHQHQLLLAIKGLPENYQPRIGILAERLQIQPHSAVELANRLARAGYVRRKRDSEDGREVLLSLTVKGERLLRRLSLDHRAELQTAGPRLMAALRRIAASKARGNGKKTRKS